MRSSQVIVPLVVAPLVGAAVLGRVLPHAPNLALLGAVAFITGRYLPRHAHLITLGTAIGSDWLIGFYDWPVMLSVWASYLLISWLGRSSRALVLRPLHWRPVLGVAGLTLAGSLLFFLVTNTAVWAAGWYPPTVFGWIQSLINGLPFVRNTITSDLTAVTTAIAAIEGALAVADRQLLKRRPLVSRPFN